MYRIFLFVIRKISIFIENVEIEIKNVDNIDFD